MPAAKIKDTPKPEVDDSDVWRDRLVRHDPAVPLAKLMANPMNWRIHPGNQQELIRESLESLGWLRSILENVNTGCIVDGHQRLLEADKAGQPTVPVDYVDLTPEEEAQALATLDAMVALAVADKPKLAELVGAIAEDRAKAGKDGYASSPAIDAFLASLAADRRAAMAGGQDPNGGYQNNGDEEREPAVIGTSYEGNPTRQITLHYSADEYNEVSKMLAWARDFFSVDTTTEAVTCALRELYDEAGRPDAPDTTD